MSDEELPQPAPVSPALPEDLPATVDNVHEVALEVLAGHYGRGRVRRAKLEKAGYNPDIVLLEVDNILNR